MPLAPLVIGSQPRCKLCACARRADCDAAIARWKSRELTVEELFEQLAEFGIENPTLDNIKGHTGTKAKPKHVRFVSHEEGEREEREEDELRVARAEEAKRILDRVCPDWREETPAPDQIVELHRALYVWELHWSIEAGRPIGLTHDHALKGVGEATKRKQNEAVGALLGVAAKGLGRAFEQALGPGALTPALPAGDEILVEADEAEDAEYKPLVEQ